MASRPGRAGADAQASNLSDKSSRIYRDLDLFFKKKGTNSDVNKVEDIQAVKRSIRNLFTQRYTLVWEICYLKTWHQWFQIFLQEK